MMTATRQLAAMDVTSLRQLATKACSLALARAAHSLDRAHNNAEIVRFTAAVLLDVMPCVDRFDGWPDLALLDLVIGFIASAPPTELPPLIERARAEYRRLADYESRVARDRMTTRATGQISVPPEWLAEAA